ncbi:MAG: hypothetical protein H0S83_11670, partial [Desulfovibrio alaskensis]|nr:hypothetical protein [Oleidesulfovibrio alaskensis]
MLKVASDFALALTVTLGVLLIWRLNDQIAYILWLFALPPAAFFTFGTKRAAVALGLLLIALLLSPFVSPAAMPPETFSLSYFVRVIAAFFTLSLFSALGEYSRAHTQRTLVALTREMEQCACTDPLTGLLNRRGIYDRLN